MAKKTAVLEVKPAKELEQASTSLSSQVMAFKIACTGDLQMAASLLNEVDALIKKVHDSQDPICDATHKAWKAATSERTRLLQPMDNMRTHLRQITANYTYQQEQERKRQQAEAEAKAQAEAEAIRQQQIADAKKAKDKAQVAALKAAPLPVVVVAPVAEAPKVEGIRTVVEYDFEIVDGAKVPREYLLIDNVKIRAVVRAMKKETNIPGVRVVERHRTDLR